MLALTSGMSESRDGLEALEGGAKAEHGSTPAVQIDRR